MQAWEQFILQQEREIGRESVAKWLRPLEIVKFDACNLYLQAKDTFQQLWFEEHMRKKVQAHLFNNNKKKIKVHLSVASFLQKKREGKTNQKSLKQALTKAFEIHFETVDPTCTWDNWITSDANQLPSKFLAKTIGIEKKPELAFCNPIYFYGPSGSGKTHLLNAAYHHLSKLGYKVVYARAEVFTEHVVGAIRGGEMGNFRQAYRNADVLIIDDVHVFAKKGATQEEFFHTFNTLHLAGKQIILSANSPPQELGAIEPRLISRFEWGIVLPLVAASGADLKLLLIKKAEALSHPIPPKVADFLLETFSRNPKALMHSLEALILRHHMNQPKNPLITPSLTPHLAKHYLSDLIIEEKSQELTPQKIIQTVAEHFGIRSEDILGKVQTRECSLPRQLAMFLCRHELKIPFLQIGDLFHKNHSTVMTSVKRIQEGLQERSSEIQDAHRAILKKIAR